MSFGKIGILLSKLFTAAQTIEPTSEWGNFLEKLGWVITWIWEGVCLGIYNVVRWLLALVDFMQYFVQKLIGLDYWLNRTNYTFEGAMESDLIFGFLYNDTVQKVFRAMMGVFFVLLIVFTIFAIIKSEWEHINGTGKGGKFGDGSGNSKTRIFRSSMKAVAIVIIFPIILMIGIMSSNAILASLIKALNIDTSSTLGGQLFQIASQNANKYEKYAHDPDGRTAVSDEVTFYIKDGKYVSLGNSDSDTVIGCDTYETYLEKIQGATKYTVRSVFDRVGGWFGGEIDNSNFNGYLVKLNVNGKAKFMLVNCQTSGDVNTKEGMYYYLKCVLQVPIVNKYDSFSFEKHDVVKKRMVGDPETGFISNLDLNEEGFGAISEAMKNTWNYASIYKKTYAFEDALDYVVTRKSTGTSPLNVAHLGVNSAKVMFNSPLFSTYFDGGERGIVQMQSEYLVMAEVVDFINQNNFRLHILDINSPLINWNGEGSYTVDSKWVGDKYRRDAAREIDTKPFVISYSDSCNETEMGNVLYFGDDVGGNQSELKGAKYIMCIRVEGAKDSSGNLQNAKYIPLVNNKTYTDPVTGKMYNFKSSYYSSSYKGLVLAKGILDSDATNSYRGEPTYLVSGSKTEGTLFNRDGSYVGKDVPYYYDMEINGTFNQFAKNAGSLTCESLSIDGVSCSLLGQNFSYDLRRVNMAGEGQTPVYNKQIFNVYKVMKGEEVNEDERESLQSPTADIVRAMQIDLIDGNGLRMTAEFAGQSSDDYFLFRYNNKLGYAYYFMVYLDSSSETLSILTYNNYTGEWEVASYYAQQVYNNVLNSVTQRYFVCYDIEQTEGGINYTAYDKSLTDDGNPVTPDYGFTADYFEFVKVITRKVGDTYVSKAVYQTIDMESFVITSGSNSLNKTLFFNVTFETTSTSLVSIKDGKIVFARAYNPGTGSSQSAMQARSEDVFVQSSQFAKFYLYDFYHAYVGNNVKVINPEDNVITDASKPSEEDDDWFFECKIDSEGFSFPAKESYIHLYDGGRYVATIYKTASNNDSDAIANVNGLPNKTTYILYNDNYYYNIRTQNKHADETAMSTYYEQVTKSMVIKCVRDNRSNVLFDIDFLFVSLIPNLKSRFIFMGMSEKLDREWVGYEFYITDGIQFDYFFEGKSSLITFYIPSKISYWIIIIASALMIKVLGTAIWGVIKRIYEITLYFIAAPAVASTIPLDDGNKFTTQIQQPLIRKVLGTYGTMLGINVFFILLYPVKSLSQIFTPEDIATSNSYFLKNFFSIFGLEFQAKMLNMYVYILFVLVAFTMISALPGMISQMIGADDVHAEGQKTKKAAEENVKEAMDTASGKKLMDAGKKTADFVKGSPVGKLAGLGAKAVKGIKDRASKGVSDVDEGEEGEEGKGEGEEGKSRSELEMAQDDAEIQNAITNKFSEKSGGKSFQEMMKENPAEAMKMMEEATAEVSDDIEKNGTAEQKEALNRVISNNAVPIDGKIITPEQVAEQVAQEKFNSSTEEIAQNLVGESGDASKMQANAIVNMAGKNGVANQVIAKAMGATETDADGKTTVNNEELSKKLFTEEGKDAEGQKNALERKKQAVLSTMSEEERAKFEKMDEKQQAAVLAQYDVSSTMDENGNVSMSVAKLAKNGSVDESTRKDVGAETVNAVMQNVAQETAKNEPGKMKDAIEKTEGGKETASKAVAENIANSIDFSKAGTEGQDAVAEMVINSVLDDPTDSQNGAVIDNAMLAFLQDPANKKIMKEFQKITGLSDEKMKDKDLVLYNIQTLRAGGTGIAQLGITQDSYKDKMGGALQEAVQNGDFKVSAWELYNKTSEKSAQEYLDSAASEVMLRSEDDANLEQEKSNEEIESLIEAIVKKLLGGKSAEDLAKDEFKAANPNEDWDKLDPSKQQELIAQKETELRQIAQGQLLFSAFAESAGQNSDDVNDMLKAVTGINTDSGAEKAIQDAITSGPLTEDQVKSIIDLGNHNKQDVALAIKSLELLGHEVTQENIKSYFDGIKENPNIHNQKLLEAMQNDETGNVNKDKMYQMLGGGNIIDEEQKQSLMSKVASNGMLSLNNEEQLNVVYRIAAEEKARKDFESDPKNAGKSWAELDENERKKRTDDAFKKIKDDTNTNAKNIYLAEQAKKAFESDPNNAGKEWAKLSKKEQEDKINEFEISDKNEWDKTDFDKSTYINQQIQTNEALRSSQKIADKMSLYEVQAINSGATRQETFNKLHAEAKERRVIDNILAQDSDIPIEKLIETAQDDPEAVKYIETMYAQRMSIVGESDRAEAQKEAENEVVKENAAEAIAKAQYEANPKNKGKKWEDLSDKDKAQKINAVSLDLNNGADRKAVYAAMVGGDAKTAESKFNDEVNSQLTAQVKDKINSDSTLKAERDRWLKANPKETQDAFIAMKLAQAEKGDQATLKALGFVDENGNSKFTEAKSEIERQVVVGMAKESYDGFNADVSAKTTEKLEVKNRDLIASGEGAKILKTAEILDKGNASGTYAKLINEANAEYQRLYGKDKNLSKEDAITRAIFLNDFMNKKKDFKLETDDVKEIEDAKNHAEATGRAAADKVKKEAADKAQAELLAKNPKATNKEIAQARQNAENSDETKNAAQNAAIFAQLAANPAQFQEMFTVMKSYDGGEEGNKVAKNIERKYLKNKIDRYNDELKITPDDYKLKNPDEMGAKERKRFEFNKGILQQEMRNNDDVIGNLFKNTNLLDQEEVVLNIAKTTGMKFDENIGAWVGADGKVLKDGNNNIQKDNMIALKAHLDNTAIANYMNSHEVVKDKLLNLGAQDMMLTMDKETQEIKKADAVLSSSYLRNEVTTQVLKEAGLTGNDAGGLDEGKVKQLIEQMLKASGRDSEANEKNIEKNFAQYKTELALHSITDVGNGNFVVGERNATKFVKATETLEESDTGFKTALNREVTRVIDPASYNPETSAKEFFKSYSISDFKADDGSEIHNLADALNAFHKEDFGGFIKGAKNVIGNPKGGMTDGGIVGGFKTMFFGGYGEGKDLNGVVGNDGERGGIVGGLETIAGKGVLGSAKNLITFKAFRAGKAAYDESKQVKLDNGQDISYVRFKAGAYELDENGKVKRDEQGNAILKKKHNLSGAEEQYAKEQFAKEKYVEEQQVISFAREQYDNSAGHKKGDFDKLDDVNQQKAIENASANVAFARENLAKERIAQKEVAFEIWQHQQLLNGNYSASRADFESIYNTDENFRNKVHTNTVVDANDIQTHASNVSSEDIDKFAADFDATKVNAAYLDESKFGKIVDKQKYAKIFNQENLINKGFISVNTKSKLAADAETLSSDELVKYSAGFENASSTKKQELAKGFKSLGKTKNKESLRDKVVQEKAKDLYGSIEYAKEQYRQEHNGSDKGFDKLSDSEKNKYYAKYDKLDKDEKSKYSAGYEKVSSEEKQIFAKYAEKNLTKKDVIFGAVGVTTDKLKKNQEALKDKVVQEKAKDLYGKTEYAREQYKRDYGNDLGFEDALAAGKLEIYTAQYDKLDKNTKSKYSAGFETSSKKQEFVKKAENNLTKKDLIFGAVSVSTNEHKIAKASIQKRKTEYARKAAVEKRAIETFAQDEYAKEQFAKEHGSTEGFDLLSASEKSQYTAGFAKLSKKEQAKYAAEYDPTKVDTAKAKLEYAKEQFVKAGNKEEDFNAKEHLEKYSKNFDSLSEQEKSKYTANATYAKLAENTVTDAEIKAAGKAERNESYVRAARFRKVSQAVLDNTATGNLLKQTFIGVGKMGTGVGLGVGKIGAGIGIGTARMAKKTWTSTAVNFGNFVTRNHRLFKSNNTEMLEMVQEARKDKLIMKEVGENASTADIARYLDKNKVAGENIKNRVHAKMARKIADADATFAEEMVKAGVDLTDDNAVAEHLSKNRAHRNKVENEFKANNNSSNFASIVKNDSQMNEEVRKYFYTDEEIGDALDNGAIDFDKSQISEQDIIAQAVKDPYIRARLGADATTEDYKTFLKENASYGNKHIRNAMIQAVRDGKSGFVRVKKTRDVKDENGNVVKEEYYDYDKVDNVRDYMLEKGGYVDKNGDLSQDAVDTYFRESVAFDKVYKKATKESNNKFAQFRGTARRKLSNATSAAGDAAGNFFLGKKIGADFSGVKLAKVNSANVDEAYARFKFGEEKYIANEYGRAMYAKEQYRKKNGTDKGFKMSDKNMVAEYSEGYNKLDAAERSKYSRVIDKNVYSSFRNRAKLDYNKVSAVDRISFEQDYDNLDSNGKSEYQNMAKRDRSNKSKTHNDFVRFRNQFGDQAYYDAMTQQDKVKIENMSVAEFTTGKHKKGLIDANTKQTIMKNMVGGKAKFNSLTAAEKKALEDKYNKLTVAEARQLSGDNEKFNTSVAQFARMVGEGKREGFRESYLAKGSVKALKGAGIATLAIGGGLVTVAGAPVMVPALGVAGVAAGFVGKKDSAGKRHVKDSLLGKAGVGIGKTAIVGWNAVVFKTAKKLPETCTKYENWNKILDHKIREIKRDTTLTREQKEKQIRIYESQKIYLKKPDNYQNMSAEEQGVFDLEQDKLKRQAFTDPNLASFVRKMERAERAGKPAEAGLPSELSYAGAPSKSRKEKHLTALNEARASFDRFRATAAMRNKERDYGDEFEKFARTFMSRKRYFDMIKRYKLKTAIQYQMLSAEQKEKERRKREEAMKAQLNSINRTLAKKVARDNKVSASSYMAARGITSESIRYKDGSFRYRDIQNVYHAGLRSRDAQVAQGEKNRQDILQLQNETININNMMNEFITFANTYKGTSADFAEAFKKEFKKYGPYAQKIYDRYALSLKGLGKQAIGLGALERSPIAVQQRKIMEGLAEELSKYKRRVTHNGMIPASDEINNMFIAKTFTGATTKAEVALHKNEADELSRLNKLIKDQRNHVSYDSLVQRLAGVYMADFMRKNPKIANLSEEAKKNKLEQYFKARLDNALKVVHNDTAYVADKNKLEKLNGRRVKKSDIDHSRHSKIMSDAMKTQDNSVYQSLVREVNSTTEKHKIEKTNLDELVELQRRLQLMPKTPRNINEIAALSKAINKSEVKLKKLETNMKNAQKRKRDYEQAFASTQIKEAKANSRVVTYNNATSVLDKYVFPIKGGNDIVKGTVEAKQVQMLVNKFISQYRQALQGMIDSEVIKANQDLKMLVEGMKNKFTADFGRNMKYTKQVKEELSKHIERIGLQGENGDKKLLGELQIYMNKFNTSTQNLENEMKKLGIDINSIRLKK